MRNKIYVYGKCVLDFPRLMKFNVSEKNEEGQWNVKTRRKKNKKEVWGLSGRGWG